MSGAAAAFLRGLPPLAAFSHEQIDHIAAKVRPVAALKGKRVFREGDPGDSLYFIASGKIRVLKTIDQQAGTAKSLAVLPPGSFVGEMTLLDGAPRSATALAEEDTGLFLLRREDFETLLEEDPLLAIRFVSALFSTITQRKLRTATELMVLYEIGLALGKEDGMQNIPAYFLEVVTKALCVERGLLILHNTLADRFQVEITRGLFEKDVLGAPLTKRHPLMTFLTQEKKGIGFQNYFKTQLFNPQFVSGFEEDVMLISPLLVGGAFTGAVVVLPTAHKRAFEMSDLNLLMGVSSMAAAAIHRASEQRNRKNKSKLGQKRFSH